MEARSVKIVHAGAALGEIQTEGELFNEQNELIATFRQRFRLWMSRPILEVRIDLDPIHPPSGYGWHAYYGCRFAVRDDRAAMFRGVAGSPALSSHTRPMSAEFIEFRSAGRSNVCVFPNGLPFHQRNGSRFLDTLLIPEGETGRSFDIALGIDRELPAQTAQGLITPVPVLKTSKGPPSAGPSAWLFQVDAPNLLLNNLRPEVSEAGKAAAILARLIETAGFGGSANLNCVRSPTRASQLDGNGTPTSDLTIGDNSVTLDFSAGDLLRVRLEMD